MKILLLITGLAMGGAEKMTVGLADALVDRGHEVRIAYMTGNATVLPSHPRIKITNLSMTGAKDAVAALFKLRNLINEFQPDVLHSHMVHANILARLVRLTVPVKRLISTAHNANEGGKLRMLAYRLTDWLADISTNVSVEAVDAFIQAKAVAPGRMMALHNGIRTDAFAFNAVARDRLRAVLQTTANTKLILAVGRLTEAKDYPNLLHAFSQLQPSASGCPDVRLCIVGDGPLRAQLNALSVKLDIADRVLFLGVRHDVADLMSAADVFVLSSAWEGFGLVVAEAMACERVVVATDCGGVREVLGRAGYLVKPRDSQLLAQSLTIALQLPPMEGAALGHVARQQVLDHFSIESAVGKWLKLYAVN